MKDRINNVLLWIFSLLAGLSFALILGLVITLLIEAIAKWPIPTLYVAFGLFVLFMAFIIRSLFEK